ncbi:hypothetical protein D3C81_1607550 [compost metagenome]
MQQRGAPAKGVEQASADQATDHEQEGDGDRTNRRPVALQVKRTQHLRGKGVHGEHRDHRAGPKQGDEQHALAVAGVQQAEKRQLAGLGFFRQVAQRETRAIDPLDHLLGLGQAALADQPARRLWGTQANGEQQRADHRRTGQYQAPGIIATVAQDRLPHHVGGSGAGKPQHRQGGQARAAVLLGQELHQQRGGHRVLDAHRDADGKTQQEQGQRRLHPELGN